MVNRSFWFALFGSLFTAGASLADTLVVTSTADSGVGTLRQAILDANANSVPDDIVFNIPGNGILGLYIIRPATPLPDITGDGTRILGETQRAFGSDTNTAGPEIGLDGTNISAGAANGITLSANNCLIREINVRNFKTIVPASVVIGNGIVVAGENNRIEGCYIGTNARGNSAQPNQMDGIRLTGPNNTIGGSVAGRNIIAGNTTFGIRSEGAGASGNTFSHNYFGITPSGDVPVGSGAGGLAISGSANNVIDRNVFAAAGAAGGLSIGPLPSDGTVSGGNLVTGNFIGTDATGRFALGNGRGCTVSGPNNLVGGTDPAARNIMSGNSNYGLSLGNGSVAKGNFIGTDVTGTKSVPNIVNAVVLGVGCTLGGSAPGEGNVISGNMGNGVIMRASASNNVIQGNFIGVDASGVTPLGNKRIDNFNYGYGIFLESISSEEMENNLIGGTVPGAGNVIAYNDDGGVFITLKARRNGILGNSIYGNGGLGIDLAPFSSSPGITPNDSGDGDSGANEQQNFPVLTSVTNEGPSGLTIQGTLNSAANTLFRIEFFGSDTPDGSGFGEGQRFLGTTNVTTDGSGKASFSENFPQANILQSFTATATDPANNTSEFSAAVQNLRITEISRVNNDIRVRFTSIAGRNYALEYGTTLTPEDWRPVPGANSLPGIGSDISVTDPGAVSRRRAFYRAVLLPPF